MLMRNSIANVHKFGDYNFLGHRMSEDCRCMGWNPGNALNSEFSILIHSFFSDLNRTRCRQAAMAGSSYYPIGRNSAYFDNGLRHMSHRVAYDH